MDMSGAMPRSAWIEIRDQARELMVSIPAQIDGGRVTAEIPAFPPSTLGTIQLCTEDGDGTIDRDEPELRELPTEAQIMLVEMG